jgi:hypothetical protein
MVNPLTDKQELIYEPVHEDMDFLAQVVRFVAMHSTVLHINTVGHESEPGFQISKNKLRGISKNSHER